MEEATMAQVWDRRRVGGVALRGLLTAVFVVAAGMKFAAVPFEVAGFTRFGYPLWFMDVVGALQLLGAVLLWTRGCVALGAGLLAVLMVGAVGSHLLAGDPALMPLPASVLLVLLSGVAYARRFELLRPGTGAEMRRA
jgi:putative oxidoreductase